MEKATKSLIAVRRLKGNTCGLRQAMMRYIYIRIQLNMSYEAIVWWVKTTLTMAQRLTCLFIIRAIFATPIAALEIMLGLLPIDLFIMAKVRNSNYRLKCNSF